MPPVRCMRRSSSTWCWRRRGEAGASDVHCSRLGHSTALSYEVRWRIDGVLQLVGEFPRGTAADVVSRLKVLAELLTYRTDVPQEGRIRGDGDASSVEMRVSTFPTLHGERAVVRLFAGASQYLYPPTWGCRRRSKRRCCNCSPRPAARFSSPVPPAAARRRRPMPACAKSSARPRAGGASSRSKTRSRWRSPASASRRSSRPPASTCRPACGRSCGKIRK